MQEVTKLNKDEDVRVRFAPSPTGFLHVGGARTAIFNWLFARNRGGKFLLRIEDTDIERSRSELSEQIIRSLDWLGIKSDEPIVYQASRVERHKEIALKLLEERKAYYAFETPEELEHQRKLAKEKKIPYKYNRESLKLTKETIEKYLKEGKQYAIRFMVPEGKTEFNDIVHGKTTFVNSEIDDFVILRSDGTPVYMIAVVVDDHDMGITHVIRGDDHLTNTPKQIMLYEALGWKIPEFAHLPMIFDESKKKLSKRRNTVSVEEYQKLGYLPEALFNFLTLLGFAPEERKEILSKDELIRGFTFERVNRKSAVFDLKKLNWINSEYIKNSDNAKLRSLVKNYLTSSAKISNEIMPDDIYLDKVITLMKGRISTINEIGEFGKYFFKDPITYDEKTLGKYWKDEIKPSFREYIHLLEKQSWTKENLESELRKFTEEKNIKASELIHLLRLILTGSYISPGIFELMEVLGKDTVLRRISRFLSRVC